MITTDDKLRRPRSPLWLLLLDWVRFALGIRRGFWVGQTRYKELGAEPLEHALSRRGSGAKEYRVRFADGRRMVIAATHERVYADLVGARNLASYQAAASAVRPGDRVVVLRAGTGYFGAWLSDLVGPSGAVVALEPDAESVRYARARYRLSNVSFETGGVESLAGETAGAFNAALAIRALLADQDAAATLAELWRVLRPGGILIVGVEPPSSEPGGVLRLDTSALRDLVTGALAERPPARIDLGAGGGIQFAVAVAPSEEQPASQ